MDTLRFLKEREEALVRERARIDRDLEEVRVALAAVAQAREAMDGYASADRPTIKEMARVILAKADVGLSAEMIMREMRNQFDAEVPRTSLSPQLSRLKQDGLVDLNERTGLWSLTDVGKNSSLRRRFRATYRSHNTTVERRTPISDQSNENG